MPVLALIVLIVIPAPNSNVVPCRSTFVTYHYQAMRYVWAHMSHIKMKRLIYAVEAGFLAWILAIFFEVMTPLLKAVVSW